MAKPLTIQMEGDYTAMRKSLHMLRIDPKKNGRYERQ